MLVSSSRNAAGSRFVRVFLTAAFSAAAIAARATADKPIADSVSAAATVNADFPGGNIKVTKSDGGTIHVEPDLRGDNPWFYWCFEATATKPGRVTFVFPEKVAGFKNGAIGLQGPAMSVGAGKSWKWIGTDRVDGSSFYHDFAKANERVRFAVTIPYVEANLSAFVDKHSANVHLTNSVLTKSGGGRDVELLRIGAAAPGVEPMLVTARHHAAETMASFVLEGFLAEAMSDGRAGTEFRKRHVLYAVPLVDKDGVERGDQGKNRKPHDHNRDYGRDHGEKSIYAEIRAIKELDKVHDFRFSLDFHCPTLVMADHQVMYFVGAREHPRHNFDNVSELAVRIKRGLPKSAPVGPLVWLKADAKQAPMNSHYFAYKENAILAATLEFPFAPPGKAADPASCRAYGRVILEAWVNTPFVGLEEDREQ